MYGIDFIFVLDAIGVIGARILPQELRADDGDGDALEAPGWGQGLGPVAAIEVAARGTDVGEVAHIQADQLAILAGEGAVVLQAAELLGRGQAPVSYAAQPLCIEPLAILLCEKKKKNSRTRYF